MTLSAPPNASLLSLGRVSYDLGNGLEHSQMATTTRTPHLGRATLSNSRWYLDQLISFLATGDDTEGQFALLRFHGMHGVEPPPHIHWEEDETAHLLEGDITFYVGGKTIHASPGDIVVLPHGIEHTFTSYGKETKFLAQLTPAGFERYFWEMSLPAEFMGPCPNPQPADVARLAETARRYGCEFTQPKQ
jgi:quercetin dioxygenase-like cupin family protein